MEHRLMLRRSAAFGAAVLLVLLIETQLGSRVGALTLVGYWPIWFQFIRRQTRYVGYA